MSKLVFYGVVILIILNLSMFFIILVNKVKNNRKIDIFNKKKASYLNMIDQTIKGEGDGITRPVNSTELEALKEALLYSFDYYGQTYYDALKTICREAGIVKEEIKGLSNPQVLRRATAAYSLGVMRAEESLQFLLKIKSQDPVLLQTVHRAVLQIGGKKYIDFVLSSTDISETQQKIRVMELFTEVEGDIFEEMLLYLEGDDLFKKALALEVLGRRKESRVKPYIISNLSSIHKELRISALKAANSFRCCECDDSQFPLEQLTVDESWEVRSFCAKLLSYSENASDKVLNALTILLKDPNWNVRFNASESLFLLGERGIEVLAESLNSEDRFAREKAYDVLHREWTLFDLEKKLKSYSNGEKIRDSIIQFQNRSKEEDAIV